MSADVRLIGRYAMHGEIAAGGMATVHLGRLLGPVGFSRTVAIKRLHAHVAKDPEFVTMFLDEARLAARIRHPNVVSTLDVVAADHELFLVMDYVQGESLARLFRAEADADRRIPLEVSVAVVAGCLNGLHAAHEALDEHGAPLNVVHRDVSPQNILIGIDGIPRVLDFGVAKASGRVHHTADGNVKGKLAYMAPEQFLGKPVARTADVFAASIVLWELLTGERRNSNADQAQLVERILYGTWPPPSQLVPGISKKLDAIVLRGLSREPAERFQTARDMALALEECTRLAGPNEIGEYLSRALPDLLAERASMVRSMESDPDLEGAAPRKAVVDEPTTRDPPRVFAEDTSATGLTAPFLVPRPAPPRSRRLFLVIATVVAAMLVLIPLGWRRMHRGVPTLTVASMPAVVVSAAPPPPEENPTAPAPTSTPTPSATPTTRSHAPRSRPARSAPGDTLPPGLPRGRE